MLNVHWFVCECSIHNETRAAHDPKELYTVAERIQRMGNGRQRGVSRTPPPPSEKERASDLPFPPLPLFPRPSSPSSPPLLLLPRPSPGEAGAEPGSPLEE